MRAVSAHHRRIAFAALAALLLSCVSVRASDLLSGDTGPAGKIRSHTIERYWPGKMMEAVRKSDSIECLVPVPDRRADPPGLFGGFVIDRKTCALNARQRDRLVRILEATCGDTCQSGLIVATVPKLVLRIHDQDHPLELRIWDTHWIFVQGGYDVDTYCSDMRVAVLDSLYDLCQEVRRGKR